jgi:hypothetical protein
VKAEIEISQPLYVKIAQWLFIIAKRQHLCCLLELRAVDDRMIRIAE